jgi:ATP-dependent Clp protease ATP-binding subunit ClpX
LDILHQKNVDNIDKEFLQYIIPKDIKDFGLIPEIIGRRY